MKKVLLLALLFVMTALGPMAADSAILYGGGSSGQTEDLFMIDTVAQTVSLVGSDRRFGPETQIDPTGTIIYYPVQCSTNMFLVNPATGLNTGSLTLSGFPPATDTATALEFVGNTLYGSFHECGPESIDGILGTINTTTGTITTIGPMTGMDKPTGGMSYVGSTMYAVSSTDNNDSRLFTVNLTTGAATLVGNITLGGVQQESATALAYADGTMYTLLNFDSNLYSINLATGALTSEFDMGVDLNSLTALDSPSCTSDSDCDDGQFCNGTETCDIGTGNCVAVSACPPAIDGCVTRGASCDEVNDVCVDFADDSQCLAGEVCDINTGNCIPAAQAVTDVPTMGQWGMFIFMIFAGFGSLYYLRRKRIEG